MTSGLGERYAADQARWADLLSVVPDDHPVPAVAPWTVRDLLGHVVGLAGDLVTLNLGAWAAEDWTAAQVERFAGRTRDEVLDEWTMLTPRVCAMFDDPVRSGLDPLFARMAIGDVTVHEHDVREAAGTSTLIDPLDWAIVGPYRREMLDGLVAMSGLAPLRVRTDEGDDWTVGGPTPAGEVVLGRQDLWRSTTGRRTRDAVRSFGWTVDPEPYIESAWVSPTLRWPEDGAPG